MKFYTGIGSRQTPKDILNLMQDIAFKLAEEGYILRSGGASGADTAFYQGAMEQADRIDYSRTLGQIYIPWQGFVEYSEYHKDWYKILDRLPKKAEAYEIVSGIHPAWDKCSKGAKALHARNVFQVLGTNLDNPSQFLICWAKVDKHGKISGGTRTAWEIAKKYGVPCFNLYNEKDKQRLSKFVSEGL